jgi:predicted transcriptional regulator
MDKILSARVDEATVRRIGSLARRLHTSKKKIIECAIDMYVSKIEEEQNLDVLDQTFGAWHRKESADQLVDKSRKAFRRSMTRHQK